MAFPDLREVFSKLHNGGILGTGAHAELRLQERGDDAALDGGGFPEFVVLNERACAGKLL